MFRIVHQSGNTNQSLRAKRWSYFIRVWFMFVSVRKGAIKGRQEQQQQQHPKRNRIERKYAELMRSIQGKVSQIKHSQTHTPLITDYLLHIIERRNAANKYWRPRQGKKIKFIAKYFDSSPSSSSLQTLAWKDFFPFEKAVEALRNTSTRNRKPASWRRTIKRAANKASSNDESRKK